MIGLDKYERAIVEAIRRAKRIRIVSDEGTEEEISILMDSRSIPINILCNEVGLAVQGHFLKAHKLLSK